MWNAVIATKREVLLLEQFLQPANDLLVWWKTNDLGACMPLTFSGLTKTSMTVNDGTFRELPVT